ncbi:MAG: thioredoxin domain-containing protein [Candidatus Norongarragalinales archaeon]
MSEETHLQETREGGARDDDAHKRNADERGAYEHGDKKIFGLPPATLAVAVVVIGVLLISAVLLFWGGKQTAASPTPALGASALPLGQNANLEALKVKVENYLNAKFLAAQELTSKITNASEKNGLYEFKVAIMQGNETLDYATVFVTLDGKKLVIGNAVDLVDVTPPPSPTPPPKSDKPDVKLFVMSMCPYGVQAEHAMIPVIKLLGDKASFDVRFIANEGANGTFDSLHGQPEVEEDLRQVCIAANQKDKFLAYLECFVKEPAEAINAGDAAAYQAINWTKMASDCMAAAKVDVANVTACMNGAQGTELLKKNIALANQLGIGSSPTITINGGSYKGARSSEAFKQGVCNAFKTAPSECSQQLSSAAGTSNNIGCGA